MTYQSNKYDVADAIVSLPFTDAVDMAVEIMTLIFGSDPEKSDVLQYAYDIQIWAQTALDEKNSTDKEASV